MKVLVINGPNLNLLGAREPEIYGKRDFAALCAFIRESASKLGIDVELFQSNHEGAIVDRIQSAIVGFDGILINPAAYTHTSVAILDALKAVCLPTVEVHISDLSKREEFRQFSYVSLYACKTICGKGFDGYSEGLSFLKEYILNA
ncbi:MAG: type II 3-dehydroquinate dehydratase [Clostridiales bacterium]|nr:type II 3-dehydroquinate dehydratase [Clostridiales bacterium]